MDTPWLEERLYKAAHRVLSPLILSGFLSRFASQTFALQPIIVERLITTKIVWLPLLGTFVNIYMSYAFLEISFFSFYLSIFDSSPSGVQLNKVREKENDEQVANSFEFSFHLFSSPSSESELRSSSSSNSSGSETHFWRKIRSCLSEDIRRTESIEKKKKKMKRNKTSSSSSSSFFLPFTTCWVRIRKEREGKLDDSAAACVFVRDWCAAAAAAAAMDQGDSLF